MKARLQHLSAAASALTGFLVTAFAQAPIAAAFPLAKGAAPVFPEMPPSVYSLSDVDFTAIVALNNCSGSLVRYRTSRPEDKAIVLTNGHCLESGFLRPGEVAVGKNSSRSFRVLNANGNGTLLNLRAERILYATMTRTDMALYETGTTYGDIKERTGLDALTLSDERPQEGDPIRIASGYWRRIYACDVAKFIPTLREGDWSFEDSIKFTQPGCNTIGGTSGSPIINATTNEVVGVNNTGNESGRRCTTNNPCEVDEDGNVTVERGAAYGQQTYWIYSCLTEQRTIDLDKSGCQLPKGNATRRFQLVRAVAQ